MAFTDRMACILLCAGRSTRFVGGNKLNADLCGKPVGQHMTDVLGTFPFVQRVAVVATGEFRPLAASFDIVETDDPLAGMGTSLSLGMNFVGHDSESVLVALADMPFVSARHVSSLFDGYERTGGVVASSIDATAMPPAIFPAAYFGDLLASEGDTGARRLLGQASLVQAAPDELLDIDTIEDLHRARTLLRRN